MLPFKSKEEVVQEYRIKSIQEATMRVIARKGTASATMQEIAEEAGVAKGTIYLYFRDRDELVEKTFESAMLQLMEIIGAALERDLPIEEKLRAVLMAKFEFFSKNREFLRLYLSQRMPEGPPERQRRQTSNCQSQYRGALDRFTRILSEAMERDEIRTADPWRLALFIVEGSNAVVLERLNSDAPPAEEADVALLVSMVMDGIRKRS